MSTSWLERDLGPGEEETQLLEKLKALEPEGLDVYSDTGEWGTPGDVFEMAAGWLARGEPVYFTTSDHCWVSFFESAELTPYYRRSPKELENFRHIVLYHKDLVDQMLQGLDKAQSRLAKLSDDPEPDNTLPLEEGGIAP